MNKIRIIIGTVLIFLLFGITACTQSAPLPSSNTPISTPINEAQIVAEQIAEPTHTSAPTKTLAPTATFAPEPTNTPIPPTPTEKPTATASPTPWPTPTPAEFETIKSLAYIEDADPNHQLDLYLPYGEGPYPVVIMFHEGGSDKAQYTSWARIFVPQGYIVVAPNYRGWPGGQYPQDVADSFCTLAWIYANSAEYPFNTEQIFAMGHSAGGTLAAMLGVVEDPARYLDTCPHELPSTYQISGAITLTGIFDFDRAAKTSGGIKQYAVELLGGEDAEVWAEASAITWVDGSEPPFLILHGADDHNIRPSQSSEFAEALIAAGVPTELQLIKGANHMQISYSAETVSFVENFLSRIVSNLSAESQALAIEKCLSAELPETACIGVKTNGQWEPIIREFNQVEMVLVPAGCFQMGNADGFPEEQPVHEICFDEPFWIDLTEVTVSQFANFLNGQPGPVDSLSNWLDIEGHLNNTYRYQLLQKNAIWYPRYRQDNRPLERVTWVGANDYCNWRGSRLPTEAEWEYAARGPESYLYPWGNELDMDKIFIGRAPEVGSIPEGASWVGVFDMAVGLFEWTSSLYKPYPYQADDGREVGLDVDSTGFRVFRGSPWYHSFQEFDNISATARFEGFTDYAYWYHGVRCARSID